MALILNNEIQLKLRKMNAPILKLPLTESCSAVRIKTMKNYDFYIRGGLAYEVLLINYFF